MVVRFQYEKIELRVITDQRLKIGEGHVRIYGQVYPPRLEQNGFKVERINISEKYQKKCGINPLEDLFICSK